MTEEETKIAEKLVGKLKRHCKGINNILAEAKRTFTQAEFYLDGTGNLNLMSGPHHENNSADARPDRILGSGNLSTDSGDW